MLPYCPPLPLLSFSHVHICSSAGMIDSWLLLKMPDDYSGDNYLHSMIFELRSWQVSHIDYIDVDNTQIKYNCNEITYAPSVRL